MWGPLKCPGSQNRPRFVSAGKTSLPSQDFREIRLKIFTQMSAAAKRTPWWNDLAGLLMKNYRCIAGALLPARGLTQWDLGPWQLSFSQKFWEYYWVAQMSRMKSPQRRVAHNWRRPNLRSCTFFWSRLFFYFGRLALGRRCPAWIFC